ncbi:MAG: polysaccharide biosynthesis/export family protein [Leptolyngbyaceae bacterium]|nr:polysaccharide biosynthesis/export family protein [Leptolyngbyaceae bacterium]
MLKSLVAFGSATLMVLAFAGSGLALPLSPGDRIKLSIPEGDEFSGIYEVNLDGTLEIPYLGFVSVMGMETAQVAQELSKLLVRRKFFQPAFIQISVQILRWAPIQVTVAGETFLPGRVQINEFPRTADTSTPQTVVPGDLAPERSLTAAIRSAGGILPTADLKNIRLIRGNQEMIFDLSGVFTGDPVTEVPLIAGDQVIVPKTSFQNTLVRPSQITPAGIKVFASNLSSPASSNSSSSVKEAISFPYGSRFTQAVVAANCVGGTQATNADRVAILIHTDPLNGKTKVLEQRVEDLVRNSRDDAKNPFLMPGDGVACYDSTVTNTRDVFRSFSEILSPFGILRLLF